MAEATGIALVVIAHLNKGASTDPLLRIGGSIGIPAAARSALLLALDPDDPDGAEGTRRVLAHVKCNLAPLAPSLAYEIQPILLEGPPKVNTARIHLIGESERSGRDLLGAPSDHGERYELDEAITWLEGELSVGAVAAKNIVSRARGAGISERTLRRAKDALGVVSERIGFGIEGIWSWRLPDEGEAPP
jgi:putative DNA primase/helicase